MHGRVPDAPDAVGCPLRVGDLAPRLSPHRRLQVLPGVARVEGEDGGEVVASRAGEAQPVLLRPGLSALMGPDPLTVGRQLDAGQESAASESCTVGGRVVLLERPDLRVVVADEGAILDPLRQELCGVLVWVAAARLARQVELDRVVGRARCELGALGVVDDVVRRGDDLGEGADLAEVVVDCLKGKHLCHGGRHPRLARIGAWRSLVARCLWVAEVPGSNPGAPIPSRSAPLDRWRRGYSPRRRDRRGRSPAAARREARRTGRAGCAPSRRESRARGRRVSGPR